MTFAGLAAIAFASGGVWVVSVNAVRNWSPLAHKEHQRFSYGVRGKPRWSRISAAHSTQALREATRTPLAHKDPPCPSHPRAGVAELIRDHYYVSAQAYDIRADGSMNIDR